MAGKPRHSRRPSTLMYNVWALRCLGLYCFKKPTQAAAADTVEICLPLLLWAVFVKTTQILFVIFAILCFEEYEKYDIGSLTTHLNIMAATVSPFLTQCSLVINGKILCQILLECEEDTLLSEREVVIRSVTVFSMEGIMTLLF